MSYVARVLQPGETVAEVAHLHWIMYVKPAFFILAAPAILFASTIVAPPKDMSWIFAAGAGVSLLIGVVTWLAVWFRRWTTEIAVTDRRIIYKTGFIRRDTREMNIHRVETVNVDQSILGRILDYGTLTVRGTGAGIENVDSVADPLRVRSAIVAPAA